MRNKTITKRFIAFLLSVCMVSAACFVDSNVKASAKDIAITELALSDLGIEAGTFASGITGMRKEGLLNTVITFYGVPSATGARLHFGAWSETGREGISMLFNNDGLVLGEDDVFVGDEEKRLTYPRTQIGASEFGFTTFVGQRVLYQLKTEKVGNDIRFTAYVNRQQAAQFTIANEAEKLGNYLYFCDGTISLSDSSDTFLENSAEAAWERFTLRDFGIADGSLTTVGMTTTDLGGTLDKTLFQAKVYFPSTGSGSLYWGANGWNGILIRSAGTAPAFDIISGDAQKGTIAIDPARVSVPLIENENLELTISTEFVTDGLKVGIWFNGILYGYETFADVDQASFVRHLHANSSADIQAAYSGKSFKTSLSFEQSNEAQYEKLTLSDFGIGDGAITIGERTADTKTLDQTLFRAKLNFPTAGYGNLYLGGADWAGIAIVGDGTNVYLQAVSGGASKGDFVIEPSIAGVTLTGNENLEFGISTELLENNGTNANLKLGVWLNGALYNGRYFYSTGKVAVADVARNMHGKSLTGGLVGYSIRDPKFLKDSEEANYAKYTLGDFGVNDGSLVAAAVGTNGEAPTDLGGTIDETLFRAKLNIPSSVAGTGGLYWGGSSWNGISLVGYGTVAFLGITSTSGTTVDTSFQIDPALANVAIFDNPNLEVAISTKFINPQANDVADMQVGLWLNGELYNGQYFTVTGVKTTDFTKHIHSNVNTAVYTGYSIRDKKFLAGSEEEKFTKYSFIDFGYENGSVPVVERTADAGTIDKTLFQGKWNFPTTAVGNLYWGGSDWFGLSIASDGTNLTFAMVDSNSTPSTAFVVTPGTAGVALCGNPDLELAISTEFVDATSTTTKLKVGIWINGELYNGQYYMTNTVKLSDVALNLHGKNINTLTNLQVESIKEVVLLENAPEKDFTKYTIEDFGYADGSLTAIGDRTPDAGTIDKTLFRAKMNFTKAGFGNLIWGGSSWYGINILSNATDLHLTMVGTNGLADDFTVKTDVVGEDILWGNDNLQFAISTEFVDATATDTKLKIGVWLNGELYGGRYFTTANRYPLADAALNLHAGTAGGITDALKGYSIVDVKVLDETQYTHYTLSDVGVPDGIGQAFGRFEKTDFSGTDYDKVLMGMDVTFTKVGGRIHYGVPVGLEYAGVQIRLQDDGTLILEDYNPDIAGTIEYQSVTIAPAKFGFETFMNQPITIKLTTDVVARDSEEKNDVQLGIWIDGKLAGNRYCYILNQLEQFGPCMNFSQDTGVVHYSLWDVEAPTGAMENYVLLQGTSPYLVESDTLTGNGVTYQNGDEVIVPGDYTATYEATDKAAAAEKTVILWKEYDVHVDGKLDARDLVALKKARAGSYPASKAGMKAAMHLSGTNALDNTREALVGSAAQKATELYYQMDSEGKVMPISAWVTPSVWLGYNVDQYGNYINNFVQYGAETNFLQDKYYEMMNELGINLITYQEQNYAESSEYQVLKGLALAEKFNINFYVHDSGIADDVTDKTVLAERLKEYSRYSSFAGIHVTDEPKSSSLFADADTKTLDEIQNKTYLLNSYSNTTGFVNLMTSINQTNYTAFVDEYIEKCAPQVLSFDQYPFSEGGSEPNFLKALDVIRTQSLEHNIPFTGCVGTSSTSWNTAPNSDVNNMTQEQINWSVNTLLAYGAKGYTWFTFVQPRGFAQVGSGETVTGMDYDRAGLIGADGSKTPVYDMAKNINAWTAMVDAVLMEAKSVDILAIGGNAPADTGSSKTSYGDMTLSLKVTNHQSGCVDGIIVGVFDYDGKTAYYVTNYDANHSRAVDLNFANAKTLTIYNQETMQRTYSDNQTKLELNLPAGGAALIIAE